jgi:hypothetical protein
MRAPFAALVLSLALVAATPATDPQAAAPAITGPSTAVCGVELKLKGAPGGAKVTWSVSPKPAGSFWRTFPGAHECVFASWAPGTYTVTAKWSVAQIPAERLAEFAAGKGVPVDVTDTVLSHTFTLTGRPAPDPGPDPGPGPGPQPDPGPTPPPPPPPPPPPTTAVKYVVVVEETADAAADRGAYFADGALQARLKSKGLVWRAVDKDAVDSKGQPPADVARFLTEGKGHPLPRLTLVDGKGRTLFAGNMPEDPAKLLDLLSKYGG